MEYFGIMAAGGCSAIDVVSILQKGCQNVTNFCEVKLTSERREDAPRLFTHINLYFIVTGSGDLKERRRCARCRSSAEKYCLVALMLEKRLSILPIRMKYRGVTRDAGWRRGLYPAYLLCSRRPG